MNNLSQKRNSNNFGLSKIQNTLSKIKNSVRFNKNVSTSSGNSMVNNKNKIIKIVVSILILVLLIFLIYIIIAYFNYSNTDCYTKKSFFYYITDFGNSDVCLASSAPNLPIYPTNQPVLDGNNEHEGSFLPTIFEKEEVFHIANQDYTYEQSKCKCESYGGRLATKSEVIDAYNSGASWCTYGWTEGQNAFYPVQQCDYDKMEKENERLPDNAKRYCGLPGVNGGYFPNSNIKFGVNCYGVKPKGHISKPKEPYCPPQNFCSLENNYQASHKLDTDEIVGFNNNQWNQNI